LLNRYLHSPQHSFAFVIVLLSLLIGTQVQAQFDPLKLSGTDQRAKLLEQAEEQPALPGSLAPLLDDQVQPITVLGQNLFNGNFGKQSYAGFNPYYRISVGDRLTIQLWGAIESNGELFVDSKGNIFISQVGPVKVAGVLNSELNDTVANAIKKIYKKDVYVYVSLLESQPVRVFVTGNVMNPGLYSGLSSESILAYLDRAGGIDPLRGSYIDIKLKRGEKTVDTFNLYDFLVKGSLPQKQLYEGDVVIVGSRNSVISFAGLVEKPYQVEFINNAVPLSEAIALVQPLPSATHIAIERNQGLVKQAEYLNLDQALANEVFLFNGDSVNVVSDKVRGTIAVLVNGEHQGQAQYVLPYGAKLADLMALIKPSERSDMASLQMFRESLAQKQKAALLATLNTLQTQVMSARSDTVEEASLRAREASLIMQFVEKAKAVEPKGQVVLSDPQAAQNMLLENGDQLTIMAKSALVNVSGEVLFPNAVIHNSELSLNDYIGMAGGYTQNAKKARVILRKTNGAVQQITGKGKTVHKKYQIEAGDELLVLPDIDNKNFQHAKDIFQIVYQLALSAGVVLSID
jgi:protein involved in polysaccharide export with SLBB domain